MFMLNRDLRDLKNDGKPSPICVGRGTNEIELPLCARRVCVGQRKVVEAPVPLQMGQECSVGGGARASMGVGGESVGVKRLRESLN